LDWDETMLALAKVRLNAPAGVEVKLVHSDYRGLPAEMERLDWEADGILLDLGLNSAQIEDSERGIAFKEDGPLDMRMDRSVGEPASAMLNRMSLDQIEHILWNFGDEKWARAIARKIVERRKEKPLRTTQDLVDCVLAAIPVRARDKRIHAATRTFQAVRIAVNEELEGLDETIAEIGRCLKPGGVLAVLSYHSGEDRAAKHAMRELSDEGFEELYKKPAQPSAEEIVRNPRSRSAKLRAIRRTS
ncbi:MAG: 16S rRNA (cytosine(1402)-N(4))-methyltransferase RsmH, partial [Chlorobia bacterium]|nr:16S rRNA (cytosine(1402)-N(4))-methyltransferase RsmH [Fimbriimonadaceae bacterium]